MTSAIRRKATIHGRVQGVSFRYYTVRTAQRLGVTGWVRNLADGTVELEVQGDAEAVAELLSWAEDGPPDAHVSGIDVSVRPIESGETSFGVTS